jgi:superfamily II DNA/RNA helicase
MVPAALPFSGLSLHPALLTTLGAQGLTDPTPIQAAVLGDAVAGRNVLGRARTGSGKTLAFGLAALTRLAGHRAAPRYPLGLVLVPTRELAAQVSAALAPYAAAVGLRITTVVGGLSLGRQADELNRGAEIVVATPGRLNDLAERGACRLSRIVLTVLDEADRMADMGFLPQITTLLNLTPPTGQRMLFSATLDGDVDRLVRRFLVDPVRRSVDPSAGAIPRADHHVLHVQPTEKNETTARIAARDGQVMLFVGTKHRADRLVKHLRAHGVAAAALHGGKSQPQRTRILDQFRTGMVNALVATDLAARGIHIDSLDLVVNVDPPNDAKDYLHRGGRTARAGQGGTVVTLVLPEQHHETARLIAAAGITAGSTRVSPGSLELARITGARPPSGVPITPPPAARPNRTPAARTPAARTPAARTPATRTPAARTVGRPFPGRRGGRSPRP